MNIYVFDTNIFTFLERLAPTSFPSVWEKINLLASQERIISVKEVYRELKNGGRKPHLEEWMDNYKTCFKQPSNEELAFVRRIFEVKHFQQLISDTRLLKGGPVADPFIVAAAHQMKASVVTFESQKPNAAKIPNVCEYFNIDCLDFDGFLAREGWSF